MKRNANKPKRVAAPPNRSDRTGTSLKAGGGRREVAVEVVDSPEKELFRNVRKILANARATVYTAANSAMVEAYWNVVREIVEKQGGAARAKYGDGLIKASHALLCKCWHETSSGNCPTRPERRLIMGRTINHALFDNAKQNKNDEFYTQMSDIERELANYKAHFSGKTVYCNCDDPTRSNFYRYFAEHFHELGLKKVIASCISKPICDLFSPFEPGFFYEYAGVGTAIPTKEDVHFFSGNGDFRSKECLALLEKSDVVVTNPPFSLFREFVAQVVNYDKQFLVIANVNALTYKEIFTLIQANQAWMGVNMGRGISGFIVPDHYDLYGLEAKINDKGERIVATNNCMWLTNLDLPERHDCIPLVKTYCGNESAYPKFDNCDAINVDRMQNIPCDYDGLMGVPITFLHRFNPSQFEIVKFRKGDDGKDLAIDGRTPYFRILIRPVAALDTVN